MEIKGLTIDALSIAEYFYEKVSFAEFLTPKNPMTKGNEKFKNSFATTAFTKEQIKECCDNSGEDDRSFDKTEEIKEHTPKNCAKNLNLLFNSVKSDYLEQDEENKRNSDVSENLIISIPLQVNEKFKNYENCEGNQESLEKKEASQDKPDTNAKKLIPLIKFERTTPFLDIIESSENLQGNYQKYVFDVLQSFVPLQKINFAQVLNKKQNYTLPEATKKKTLILDLDETLIHSNFENFKNNDKGKLLEFTHQNVIYTFELFVRPGLQDFLHNMSKSFEIFIFTASKREYADRVLDHIDPDKKYISHCFYREDCIGIKDKIFVKDLSILSNRSLENIIMLDNSMYSFLNQLTNGVLITSFYDNPEDTDLYNVMGYLENYIVNAEDVRTVNNQVFGFKEILTDIHNEYNFV